MSGKTEQRLNKTDSPRSNKNDFLSKIPVEVATVIKTLPTEQKNIMLKAFVQRTHFGPLPDGESIKIYGEVIPNGGDRLMKNVEKQLDHRIAIENKGVKRSLNQNSTGQWMAFIIAIIFGIIGWDLIRSGHEMSGMFFGGVDILGLVTVFITGKAFTSKKQ